MSSAFVGLCLSLCSLCIGFTALNIQRVAQRKENPRPMLNVCGVLLNVLVGPTDMAAYTFAPQSLLAPVGTLSLVLNLVAAPRLHGDPVTRKDTVATIVIVLGTAACLVFGAHGSTEGANNPGLRTMVCYTVAMATVCSGLASVLCHGKGGRRDAVANAALAGLLGSTTVVAGKRAGQAFGSGSVAMSALPLLCLAPAHLFVINRGMGRHSPVVFVPLNVAAGLVANISSGFLLYGESPKSWPHFACGLAALIGGVLSLATQGEEASPHASCLRRSASALERGVLHSSATSCTPLGDEGAASSSEGAQGAVEALGAEGAHESRPWTVGWLPRKRKPTWDSEKPKIV